VLSAAPRIIKERHLCLPLALSTGGHSLSAMGWTRTGQIPWPERSAQFGLAAGSIVDIVYRLRENQHPTYGGLEIELIDLALGMALGDPQPST